MDAGIRKVDEGLRRRVRVRGIDEGRRIHFVRPSAEPTCPRCRKSDEQNGEEKSAPPPPPPRPHPKHTTRPRSTILHAAAIAADARHAVVDKAGLATAPEAGVVALRLLRATRACPRATVWACARRSGAAHAAPALLHESQCKSENSVGRATNTPLGISLSTPAHLWNMSGPAPPRALPNSEASGKWASKRSLWPHFDQI